MLQDTSVHCDSLNDSDFQTTTPKASCGPFIKWAGGKRQLLPALEEHLPQQFGSYFEPFLGGGALFFHLQPDAAFLADRNERLIRTYAGVRDDVDGVIDRLRTYRYEKDFFLAMRRVDIDKARCDAEVAAWFIYLNKTCFNGLYRVNRSGTFNVPFGRYVNPRILDEQALRASSAALKRATLACKSFESVADEAMPGDLVYFDPPYVPLTVTSAFTQYTAGGFGMKEQVLLRDVALDLKRRGVHVLLSNSFALAVRDLYGSAFDFLPVQVRRSLNARGSGRGPVTEVLIK